MIHIGQKTGIVETIDMVNDAMLYGNKNQKIISYMLLLTSIVILIGLCTYLIDLPGVQYDEITFSNIALGAKGDHFVTRLFGIPILAMPYIGALKGYIYYPIFSIFGVSALTIRLPMILLASVTLFIAYKLACRLTQSLWAGNSLVHIMSTSLCFIISTKMDWGPTTIMMFLLFLTLWAFFRLIDTQKLVYAYIIIFSILVGVYDKSNFIWFASAFGLSALIIYPKEFIQLWTGLGMRFWIPFSVFLSIIALYVFIVLPRLLKIGTNTDSFLLHLKRIVTIYNSTVSGSFYTGYMFATPLEFSSFYVYISLFAFICLIVFIIFFKKCEKMRTYAFVCLIPAIIFVEIILTKEACGPHHLIMLFPFSVLSLVLLYNYLMTTVFLMLSRYILTCLHIVLILAITLINIYPIYFYINHISSNKIYSPRWDPHIYELSDYVKALNIFNICSVDWGIHNQLYAFDENRNKKNYFERWPFFASYDTASVDENDWNYKHFIENKDIVFVTHGKGFMTFRNAASGFDKFQLEYFDQPCDLIHTIYNANGDELYLVYMKKAKLN